MLPRHEYTRPQWPLVLVGLVGLAASCATHPVRAVVDVVPDQVSYSFEVTADESHQRLVSLVDPGSIEIDADDTYGYVLENGVDLGQGPEVAGPGPVAESAATSMDGLGDGQKQLDPEMGPMDLGYPLLIDLGAGEAPYDDGVPTIHGVELTRGGFSDAVLQASWRESLTPTSMWHATVAVSRYQDLGILDGVEDMRFAWVVLGWKASF